MLPIGETNAQREKRCPDTHGKSVTEEALDLKISCSLFQQYKLFHIPVVGASVQ